MSPDPFDQGEPRFIRLDPHECLVANHQGLRERAPIIQRNTAEVRLGRRFKGIVDFGDPEEQELVDLALEPFLAVPIEHAQVGIELGPVIIL